MARLEQRIENAFMIEAAEMEALLIMSGGTLSTEAYLTTLVAPTKALARPPISRFSVGAVGLGASGRVFRGVNLEFPGLPLHHAVHAEQFLVASAAQHGERALRCIAVSAAPCGHCRQFLQELRGASDLLVIIDDAAAETKKISYFLPHRFGPNDVLDGDFPLLLEPRSNHLALVPESQNGPDSSDRLTLVPGLMDESDSSLDEPNLSLSKPNHFTLTPGSPDKLDSLLRGPNLSLNKPNRCTLVPGSSLDEPDSSLDEPDSSLDKANHFILAPGSLDQPDFSNRLTLTPGLPYEPDCSNCLALAPPDSLNGPNREDTGRSLGNDLDRLILAALQAADVSHAPYTNSPSGMSLMTRSGNIYSGFYMESVAFNPSLPPLQAALVAFVAQDGGEYEDIVHAVLVEREDAAVQFAGTIRLALAKISPKCSFQVRHAVPRSA